LACAPVYGCNGLSEIRHPQKLHGSPTNLPRKLHESSTAEFHGSSTTPSRPSVAGVTQRVTEARRRRDGFRQGKSESDHCTLQVRFRRSVTSFAPPVSRYRYAWRSASVTPRVTFGASTDSVSRSCPVPALLPAVALLPAQVRPETRPGRPFEGDWLVLPKRNRNGSRATSRAKPSSASRTAADMSNSHTRAM
jgi:hypothetical protein